MLRFLSLLLLSGFGVFLFLRLAPGDPVERILGPLATEVEKEALREELNLNGSLFQQAKNYYLNLLQMDLGFSIVSRIPVGKLIRKHLRPTLIIGIIAVSISFFIGAPLGAFAAWKKDQLVDPLFRVFSLSLLAFPIFSLGPILVLLFSINWQLLPVSGLLSPWHYVLPTLTLATPLSAIISRVSRNRFLEEKNSPWVQVLMAKGMSPFQIFYRLYRVIVPSVLNVIAIQLSVVLGGTIITEAIFDIPGLGMLLFEGIQNRDYPVVQGLILYLLIIYVSVFSAIKFINQKIDPRLS